MCTTSRGGLLTKLRKRPVCNLKIVVGGGRVVETVLGSPRMHLVILGMFMTDIQQYNRCVTLHKFRLEKRRDSITGRTDWETGEKGDLEEKLLHSLHIKCIGSKKEEKGVVDGQCIFACRGGGKATSTP